MALQVEVDGLQFHGETRDRGFIIEPQGFTGWLDGADSRAPDVPRPGADGSFATKVNESFRQVTIRGSAIEQSPDYLGASGEAFTSLVRGRSRIVVRWLGKTSWAWCQRYGQRSFVPSSDGLTAAFVLQLKCPMPDKFGDYTVSAPATEATFSQYGNAPAYQEYTVSGNASGGYTLWNNGLGFVVTQPLVSGHPHTIDMATGRLTVDGATVFGKTPIANVWAVPPFGEETTVNITFSGGTGSFVAGTYETGR